MFPLYLLHEPRLIGLECLIGGLECQHHFGMCGGHGLVFKSLLLLAPVCAVRFVVHGPRQSFAEVRDLMGVLHRSG